MSYVRAHRCCRWPITGRQRPAQAVDEGRRLRATAPSTARPAGVADAGDMDANSCCSDRRSPCSSLLMLAAPRAAGRGSQGFCHVKSLRALRFRVLTA
ncbi:MAG: hypothetical protein RL033_6364 [Pseudomonadota bacterium]|jgi:hypothetical protein